MARTLTPKDQTSAPANYEELYLNYYDYVVALVQRFGIEEAEAEDAASDIMLKFMEKGFLEKFDPSVEKDGHKTKFVGFLSGFVSKYVLQHRDRQLTRMRKIAAHIEQPAGENATWLDLNQPIVTDTYESIEQRDLIEHVRTHLASLPIRGKRNLARAFEIVEENVAETGLPNRNAIKDEFGISPTATHLLFTDLREAVKEAIQA